MQYTIRNISKQVDQALRRKAKQQGRSLNEVALEALALGAGIVPANGQRVKRRDLSDFAGTYVKDPGFEEAMKEMDRIDPEDWQ
jgi:hypothetical protein